MPKRGKSPEGPRGNDKSERKTNKQPETRRATGRIVDSVFVPFSGTDFINAYCDSQRKHARNEKEVQEHFEAERWGSHLLLDSVPLGAPEDSQTGAQYFDQIVAELEKIDGKERAIMQAFAITADAYNTTENAVKMWYATRDYDFVANGHEHPGDWMRHGRR